MANVSVTGRHKPFCVILILNELNTGMSEWTDSNSDKENFTDKEMCSGNVVFLVLAPLLRISPPAFLA